jgi:hypothetical protein
MLGSILLVNFVANISYIRSIHGIFSKFVINRRISIAENKLVYLNLCHQNFGNHTYISSEPINYGIKKGKKKLPAESILVSLVLIPRGTGEVEFLFQQREAIHDSSKHRLIIPYV